MNSSLTLYEAFLSITVFRNVGSREAPWEDYRGEQTSLPDYLPVDHSCCRMLSKNPGIAPFAGWLRDRPASLEMCPNNCAILGVHPTRMGTKWEQLLPNAIQNGRTRHR